MFEQFGQRTFREGVSVEPDRGGSDGPAGPAMAGPLFCSSPFLIGRCGK